MYINLLYTFLLLLINIKLCESLSRHPKLLLISFDGFRHDLVDKSMVPNIYKFAESGTWFTSGVKSQYVTYTAPNHMSIATGLYEESHGIVGNYFFDTETKTLYDYFNSTQKEGVVNASQAEYWYKADPIWLTNERWETSRRSAAMYWPNGESPFPFIPHRPKVAKPWVTYGTLKTWMEDVDQIIELFTRKDDPINFIAWYVAEPDHVLHKNGFHNGELVKVLEQLDKLFSYFVKKFEDNDLVKNINVILTADHGHAEVKDEKHVMCVKDYVTGMGFEMGDHMIYPHSEEIAKAIYTNLTNAVKQNAYNVKIHWKNEIPKEWHYSNSPRIGSIVFEPEIGSAISFSCTKEDLEKTYGENGNTKFNSSTHGMNPDRPEMRAFLIMKGPLFLENSTIPEIPENVDIYGLMCHVLNITASPNNGSMTIVKRSLKEFKNSGNGFSFNTESIGFSYLLFPICLLVLVFFIFACRHTILKSDPNWGRTDAVQGYRPLARDAGVNIGFDAAEDVERLGEGQVSMSGLLEALSDDDI